MRPSYTDYPLVSVVMTAFNEAAYIREGIESIQNQTLSEWELVVVDDGSTDATRSIVSALTEIDERIRLIESKHVGRAEALNLGLREAQGSFIAILDADDRARSGRLAHQIQYLRTHREIGIVGTACRFVNKDTGEEWTWMPPDDTTRVRLQALLGMPLPHTTIMFRRRLLNMIGGYRDRDYKDYDFLVRALQHVNGTNLQRVFVDVTVHAESVMGTMQTMEGLKKTVRSRFRALRTLFPLYLLPILAPVALTGIASKAFRVFVQNRKV